MGLSQALWNNRHWIVGIHALFIAGYVLVLMLGTFILHSFHLPLDQLKQLAIAHWYLFFLPLGLLAAGSYLLSIWTPDELTRATPATDAGRKDLQNRLESLCISLGLRAPVLYIVDYDAYNAMYWEKNSDCRLYVTRAACEGLSAEELDCMMAHQLGRMVRGDFYIYPVMSLFVSAGTQLSLGAFLVACYATVRILPVLFEDLVLGTILYAMIISFGLMWLTFRSYGQRFGHDREFGADLFAVKLTKNAMALVNAINKSKDHYYFPIVTEELRAMLFINPDPGITLPWYQDPDERIVHLQSALGAGAFEVE